MEMKEILKQSLKDGVNQFIDSTISQLDEDNEPSFDKSSFDELFEDAPYMLSFVQGVLSTKRYFSCSIDTIWACTMNWAIFLKGNNFEGMDSEIIDNVFEQYNDMSIRWEQTKAFIKYIKDNDECKQCFSYLPDLQKECDIYYYNILQLKNWKGGFFLTRKRKFKKQIHCHMSNLISACKGYQYELVVHIPALAMMGIRYTD